jgi:hypothetical protein
MNTVSNVKLIIVKYVPWWFLRSLWVLRIVDRTTVFRWEMNVFLGDWEN